MNCKVSKVKTDESYLSVTFVKKPQEVHMYITIQLL